MPENNNKEIKTISNDKCYDKCVVMKKISKTGKPYYSVGFVDMGGGVVWFSAFGINFIDKTQSHELANNGK